MIRSLPRLALLALTLAVCVALQSCAGYTIGGGLGYTNADGSRYDANVTVQKDAKVMRAPVKTSIWRPQWIRKFTGRAK